MKSHVAPKLDWSKVVDELCLCGHRKSQHDGPVQHGACTDPVCPCTRFTWKAFLDAQGKRIA